MNNDIPVKPYEIVVTHRDEKPRRSIKGESFERIARILSLVAIPVVIVISGKLIEDAVARREVNQKYVEIAVSILTESEDTTDIGLRSWAVALLEDNSPTRMNSDVLERLKSGEVSLPTPRIIQPEPLGDDIELTDYDDSGARVVMRAYDDGRVVFLREYPNGFLRHMTLHLGHTEAIKSTIQFRLGPRRMPMLAVTDGNTVWILRAYPRHISIISQLRFIGERFKSMEIDMPYRLHIRFESGRSVEHELYDLLGYDPNTPAPF